MTCHSVVDLPPTYWLQEVKRHMRRLALRVERDEAAEREVRRKELQPLSEQPAYLKVCAVARRCKVYGAWVTGELPGVEGQG